MDHPTASALDYTARDYTASLPAADFIARFRDAERIAGYCRACPNYGRSWACPPFGFDLEEYLSGYATALIVATKITPAREGLPFSEAGRLIRPERVRHERLLLDMERRTAAVPSPMPARASIALRGSARGSPGSRAAIPSGCALRSRRAASISAARPGSCWAFPCGGAATACCPST